MSPSKSTRQQLVKVSQVSCLYRHSLNLGYYGIKKLGGKRKERSLHTKDRKLAELGKVGTAVSDLLPPGSGWSGVSAHALNDGGAIVGTATYSGTNYLTGSHGVMLFPYEIDCEITQGSDNYDSLSTAPINGSGVPNKDVQRANFPRMPGDRISQNGTK
jgi:hypothetical protein